MSNKFNRNKKRSQIGERLRDTDPIPFGKYKGTAMANVPNDYLVYLYEKYMEDVQNGKEILGDSHRVLLYIEDYGIKNLRP